MTHKTTETNAGQNVISSDIPKSIIEAINKGRGGQFAVSGTPKHLADAQNAAAATNIAYKSQN